MLAHENLTEDYFIDEEPEPMYSPNPYGEASLLCGILMICVAVVGLVANASAMRVFTHRLLVSSINTLLAGLALLDAALLVTAVPLYSSVAIYSYLTRYYSYSDSIDVSHVAALETAIAYMTVYIYPFTSILQTASVWTMVLITVERYLAVCHPFIARKACTWRRAVTALLVVLVVSVLYNISRFWEYDIRIKNETSIEGEEGMDLDGNHGYVVVEVVKALRANGKYMCIYVHWLYFILLFAIPFTVLVLLNTMVVVTIKRANHFRANLTRRQSKEHATATMMVVVAIFFLSCNSLGCVLNVMDVFGFSAQKLTHSNTDVLHISVDNESVQAETNVDEYNFLHTNLFFFLIDLSNLLVMIHCSCNFFIYLTFSNRFRTYFCFISPCCIFHPRRLSDFKAPGSVDVDPPTAVSIRHNRRSCVPANSNQLAQLELLPRKSPNSVTPPIRTKGSACCKGAHKKGCSQCNGDPSEPLLHRVQQARVDRCPPQ